MLEGSAGQLSPESFVGAIGTRWLINGLGQRIAQMNGSVPQFFFVYDEAGHPAGKYDGLGNPLWETAWLGDLPVAVLEPAGRFTIAPDHLGAPHQITDAGGAVVWLRNHDPFGNGDPTGTFSYNLRFPGQFFDQRAKLHYNYFRDYDPRLGRYIESDPIGLAGGINTYAYAAQNPTKWTDRFGLEDNSGSDSGAGSTNDLSCGIIIHTCTLDNEQVLGGPLSGYSACNYTCTDNQSRSFIAPTGTCPKFSPREVRNSNDHFHILVTGTFS